MEAFSDDWTRSTGPDGTVVRCEFRDAVGVATAG